ncbi:hypothetical protein BU14_1610s0003 [Porphyra umbilicalis]|uniref:Protein YIPF n=1 Tax=Porphyra umbilicalis TaxID=2786 RepID=A0A1X6NL51_PORUM|nr:hypothetical protein BU14_1610s0003 [Porphyra umbilicalis]|eukprot:OSX69335.1 hypothetical protein BU14_1610s0003 [Porphyra umbilicalis]
MSANIMFPQQPPGGGFMQSGNGSGGGGGGGGGGDSFYQTSYGQPGGVPDYYNMAAAAPAPMTDDFDNEPPLLEELGINVDHIITKAKSVMNPFSSFPSTFAEEADMSGPIAFCLALGIILSLSGKFQFGVIYGLAITGCVSIYVVLNLMSEGGIDLYRCTSVVGYALLPMVVLSVSMLFRPGKKVAVLGYLVGSLSITWSTATATKIFVSVLSMQDQMWLIAYPLALLYTSFALIIIF